ncbi:MAG: alpha/beta hydrolase [Solirubrobacteraceae bacterium]
MEELSLDLASGRVQAVAHGPVDAPLVLCLHGLSANARAWDFLGERLAGEGRRAVALDLRGRGLTEATPPGSYGLPAHAADVLAAANALGAETFDVAGWSMGALIGILAASTAAGRLRRLVLIDHAGRMDESAVSVVRAGLDRLDTIVADPDEHVAAVRAAGGIERWSEQWDAVYRRELRRAEEGRWIARTSRAACEEDLEDMLARDWNAAWRPLAMPTLLVRSTRPIEGGFIVPADQRDGLAAAGADVTVVEVDATHSDVMTAPETWTAVGGHLA